MIRLCICVCSIGASKNAFCYLLNIDVGHADANGECELASHRYDICILSRSMFCCCCCGCKLDTLSVTFEDVARNRDMLNVALALETWIDCPDSGQFM